MTLNSSIGNVRDFLGRAHCPIAVQDEQGFGDLTEATGMLADSRLYILMLESIGHDKTNGISKLSTIMTMHKYYTK
uniref:Uncharacterized protein n=1 Tax=Leersia perrieri TaxID=77586 RepID=A0A0D9UYA6_9ORYZ